MIEVACCSTAKVKFLESAVGKKKNCPDCGKVLQFVAGEAMAEGAGSGDFDAALVADESSKPAVARYLLGGVADIVIGKLAESNIVLIGQKVSRRHCKLVRLDFGPSRWKIVDEKSTNGLFVNGKRVSEHNLADGDAITIGEFGFHYSMDGSQGDEMEPSLAGITEPGGARRLPMGVSTQEQAPLPGGNNGMARLGLLMGIIMGGCIAALLLIAVWIGESLGSNSGTGLGMHENDRTILLVVVAVIGISIPVTVLLALIFSTLGLLKARKPGGTDQGRAIAGLVLGICGLILVCASIPSALRAREKTNRIKCAQHMHHIGQALMDYARANHGSLPSSLDMLVTQQNLSAEDLSCPDAPSGSSENYVLAANHWPMPDNTVVLYEPLGNHSEGINILYGDGRIEWQPNPEAEQIVASLQNGKNPPELNAAPSPSFVAGNSSPNVSNAPANNPASGAPKMPDVSSRGPRPRPGLRGGSSGSNGSNPPVSHDITDVLPPGAVKTEMVGGNGGSPYLKVDRNQRIILGFRITIGRWANHDTIGQCEPLYETPTGPAPEGTTICMARDGYAVGGVIVNKVDGADGLQIIFMKLKGNGVDPIDTYSSPWFGETKNSNHTQLAGHGERVIGTFGRQGMNMDAIGLVVEPAAAN